MAWGQFNQGTFQPGAVEQSFAYDPETGQMKQASYSQGAAKMIGQSPFAKAFGDSVNTMSGLGGLVGGAFGAVNAANQDADQKNQNRILVSQILDRIFAGRGGAGAAMPYYADASTRMTTGGVRSGGWQQYPQ